MTLFFHPFVVNIVMFMLDSRLERELWLLDSCFLLRVRDRFHRSDMK
jgi:hypothetical protein